MEKTTLIKKDMQWKTLSSEYIFKRPWLTARRDAVQLPNGKVNEEYYVLEYPDWVNVVAITDEGKFLFVRQYRYALGKTVDEIVAGVIEEGEDPMDAAKRELKEETGYEGGTWTQTMLISSNASTCNNLTHSFLAVGVKKTDVQHLDDTEDIEVELFTPEEVLQMLRDGKIWQSLMAAPLWKYFAEKAMAKSEILQ